MMKVILTSMDGRMVDIFPEDMSMREILENLGASDERTVIRVDGRAVCGEKLEKPLHMFGRDSVVAINCLPQAEDCPEDTLPKVCVSVSAAAVSEPPGNWQISLERAKYKEACQALEELRDKLDSVLQKLKDAELPF